MLADLFSSGQMGCVPAKRAILILLITFLIMPAAALAESWRARLWDEGLPERLVAVDKKHKIFSYLEKKSPLRLRYSYPCVTGQLEGDKQQVNDLRTPEGVYFVEYKIANGLDFGEYGGIAYTLNYPNPVDRLRGKTGHGIWIHSKGYGLVPTRGCVAIGLKEIAEVGPNLSPGTAVMLAGEFEAKATPEPDKGTAKHLRRLMQDWSDSWAARSDAMFDFYDPAAYSRATENFTLFRQNKERLFKMLRFIKIFNREIHALEGPGYWVTWTEQLYTASNLSTEGVRRLYWQPGADGRYRIVGMEWTPRNMGMAAEVRQGRLVASAAATVASDAGSEAPRQPPLAMPEEGEPAGELPVLSAPPVPSALLVAGREVPDIAIASGSAGAEKKDAAAAPQQGHPGVAGLVAELDPLIPQRGKNAPPREFKWNEEDATLPRQTGMPLPAAAPDASAPLLKSRPSSQAPLHEEVGNPLPAQGQPPRDFSVPGEAASTNARSMANRETPLEAVRNAAIAWTQAFARRDSRIIDFYDDRRYNRVPDIPRGLTLARTRGDLARLAGQPWLKVVSREPQVSHKGTFYESRIDQLLVSPSGLEQGERILRWIVEDGAAPRIVANEFRPGERGLGAEYLELVSLEASRVIDAWRRAWEAARVSEYMEFYTDDAIQQNRVGSKSIRQQKEGLWSRVRPTGVQLSGLRLALNGSGLRADMTQAYADSAGKKDRGIKTLLLRYDGERWRIAREDWRPEPVMSGRPSVGA